MIAISCKSLKKDLKTKKNSLADAEAVILEWILEDGNLIKSNRVNIFHTAPKIFGFYSAENSNTGLCYNVLVLAEKFEINAEGRNILSRELNAVSSGLDDIDLSGSASALNPADKNPLNNYALLLKFSIAGYIGIIVLLNYVFIK